MVERKSNQNEHEIASDLFEQGNYHDAFEKYRVLAEGGSTTAQVFLGWMYFKGQGAKRDLEEARHWYKLAADGGSPVAQFYLGALYRLQRNYNQAIECFEKSASQGYMPATYYLALMYDAGEGVSVDKDKAYRYFERAARMGHLPAQKEIAVRMIKGKDGFSRVPIGVFRFAQVLVTAIVLGWSDPESDRIRW